MLYIYIYTKHPLTAFVQVAMIFRALQRTHQCDVTCILERRLPNTRSNVTRVVFCRRIKQKQIKLTFFRNLSRNINRIDDQRFSLGFICILISTTVVDTFFFSKSSVNEKQSLFAFLSLLLIFYVTPCLPDTRCTRKCLFQIFFKALKKK